MSSEIIRSEKNHWLLTTNTIEKSCSPNWFNKDYWLHQGRLLGANTGRGSAWTIKSEYGKWVLRHYYRGGMLAKANKDHYLWTGLNKTRSFHEFRLLNRLNNMDLPAPRAIAAYVHKKGLLYTADLIMEYIPNQKTFAKMISKNISHIDNWVAIGQTIARFHKRMVYHSDLNAHNILLDAENVFLIDFDKAQIKKQPGSWQNANLERLKRSIQKLSPTKWDNNIKSHWQALLDAYHHTL